ncbi:hypothetical protein BH18ACI4_BH18ACI4_05230 [soil metagenome]
MLGYAFSLDWTYSFHGSYDMDSDDVLKAELEKARAECDRLREDNTTLKL